MYEFSVARKYLVPRVRQLSVSCISLISVVVIATVVWLSIVFFSVQEGIEKRWTEKMLALTAPIRITPTSAYYASYYYQIDAAAAGSHFSHKSLREKLSAETTDPYNPDEDPALPPGFPKPSSLDLVKLAQKAIRSIPGLSCDIFETAPASLKVRLIRQEAPYAPPTEQTISQSSYVVSFDPTNQFLNISLLPITEEDKQNILNQHLPPLWVEKRGQEWVLPHDAQRGEGILLPKSFRDAGTLVGDRGTISYRAFGATALQEQRVPVFVAGFYDPGIIPTGGKVVLARPELVSRIHDATFTEEQSLPTGFNVHFNDLKKADQIKKELVELFKKENISPYWDIRTYEEFDFTKDILQQMKSDRNLFSLISFIIMIVACSNIISMLIILVHDKRKEIAILRALGASKTSIGAIFGLCGFIMGATGSILGAALAILTLNNLSFLLRQLGSLQGFEVLNTTFYGNNLPSQISVEALLFVIGSCACISCLSGIIPAFQASRINTSEALRNE
ncbi:MAG: ABC transporter permease [Verrucomicrobia bacterium]|nr:ABC transporter permease [Verrucomicrobiota bacterium]